MYKYNLRGEMKMGKKDSCSKRYVFAAVLGAIGGGVIVALATKAMPKIMSGMMRNMMGHMRKGGCDPESM